MTDWLFGWLVACLSDRLISACSLTPRCGREKEIRFCLHLTFRCSFNRLLTFSKTFKTERIVRVILFFFSSTLFSPLNYFSFQEYLYNLFPSGVPAFTVVTYIFDVALWLWVVQASACEKWRSHCAVYSPCGSDAYSQRRQLIIKIFVV